MRQAIDAFLLKVGRTKLLLEPNAQWSLECCEISTAMVVTSTCLAPCLWPVMYSRVLYYQKRTSVCFGNGRIALFWDHNRAVDSLLAIHDNTEIPIHLPGIMVEEIW